MKLITAIQKTFRELYHSVMQDPKVVGILGAILAIALFFRTIHYLDRIYVYADNALFVLAAYYAKVNALVPQIGPFAQAPFFTGPWWLWILEILFIFPFSKLTPWYFMTTFSLGFVILTFLVGKEIAGKRLGLLSALLAAISTAQIDNSFMTWNAAADPYIALLSIFWLIKYFKLKRPFYLFLLGFFVSLGTTIHFQTGLIAPLILVALIIIKPTFKSILALAIGGLIPLLPFLYFDLRFHWFEIRRIQDYALIGQYRIYVPNRWLTYILEFWPETWASIIGGNKWVAYLLGGLVSVFTLISLKDFKKYKRYYFVVLAFGITIVMFRYYRGERLYYYTNFAHPFVILLSAWVLLQLVKVQKLVGLLVVSVVLVFTVKASFLNIMPRTVTYAQVQNLVSDIYKSYPNKNFVIYECPFNGSIISTPVSYWIYYDGRHSDDGIKIGVCSENFNLTWRVVGENQIDKPYQYLNRSTPRVYTEMTEWWKTNPPGESLY